MLWDLIEYLNYKHETLGLEKCLDKEVGFL